MQYFESCDIFVIGANQPHLFKSDPSYFNPAKKQLMHSLNLFFNPAGFIAALLELPEMRSIKKLIAASAHSMQAPGKSSKEITDQLIKIKLAASGIKLAAFIELLQLMADQKKWKLFSTAAFEYAITGLEGLRINNVYQYSMTNYTRNITLPQIAALVHLTPQAFCRYFKKHTSKTFIHFLNGIRINEACKKFMEKDFSSIAAVAYRCGFNHLVNFNRVFKNITRQSPGAFIKEYHRQTRAGSTSCYYS